MFNVNDSVICINNKGIDLPSNTTFNVTHVELNTQDDTHSRIQLKGASQWYFAYRFKLVTSAKIEILPSNIISINAAKVNMTLPTDSKERKNYPLLDGCVRYFPAALAGVALISKKGNDKHNPGEELHHARGKSMDHGDCILRHLIDVQDLLAASPQDKVKLLEEVNQLSWRVLAYSQEIHEKFGAPLAPGAKV